MSDIEQKCLEIVKGTSKTYEITITDEDEIAQDITDWTIYFTLKEHMNDPDSSALIQKDVTSHDNAINGITLIELTALDTDIEAGNYYFDIVYKDNSTPTNVGLIIMGKIRIIEKVTRRT